MQYATLFFAALGVASALPGARKGHQHHRRHPEADAAADLSNVNWAQALAGIDWATVKYDSETTTVAVAAAAPTLVSYAAVGNVAVNKPVDSFTPVTTAAHTTSSTYAAPAAQSTAANVVTSTSSGSDYTVDVINNCAYTIWQAGWQTNTAGGIISSAVKGNEMAAGGSISLSIPKSALGVQLWARTGCTGSGSSFTCKVGDCQGFQCSSIIWQNGPIMAEFGSGLNTDQYNTGITAYDISAIPGNNVGVKIVPSVSSCETKYCPVSGCSHDQAWQSASDTDLGSPADTTCTNDTNFTVTFCPA